MKISAIITAGGTSSRYGKTNKLLEKVNGIEIIKYTVSAFIKCKEIDNITICANKSIIELLKKMFNNEEKITIIEGGSSRQESVYKGLTNIKDCDYVLIHDGARPMISQEIIEKTIKSVIEKKAVTVVTKTIDTIKMVDDDLKIIKTIDRTHLYNTQTPQAFEYKLIFDTHNKLKTKNFTDDAGMVESLNIPVYIVEGDYKNIKITTQSDLEIAKAYL